MRGVAPTGAKVAVRGVAHRGFARKLATPLPIRLTLLTELQSVKFALKTFPASADQWCKSNAEYQACLIYAETPPIDAERLFDYGVAAF